MSFSFISDAVAATAAPAVGSPAQAGSMSTIVILVIMFAVFYFLLIRPQQKRQKEHQNLVNNIQKGDEVVTSGGLLGKVVKVEDTIITIALNDTTEVKVQRNAVAGLLPKGTIK